jgi:murein peptide amidase A
MHAKLGKNAGRYHGESIPIDQVQAETHQAALRHGWNSETFFESDQATLRAYHRASSSSPLNIYVSTGVHGDEPSGPLTILRMLREDAWPDASLWLMPCLNPTGFRLNTRENADGIDLNREYRQPKAAEVRAHIQWLERQPSFDLSLLLHEDWEANGFYVYELNPENRPSLAEHIVAAVRIHCPIESAEKVDDWDCVGGIIRPQVHPEERPLWAEALYLRIHKSPLNYTLETPSDFPLPFRVGVHLQALTAALRAPIRPTGRPESFG